ncbi:S-adenosyl-L-methionine-dependent methyltransferase [Gonapodya prolifera JEL478]|uniref:type I protein arginine methyltransferase n=1 Tax=Gonapodya prolifera (strain JEL478) TaxID=1344416 RepID=A0A139ASN5_GONPJ|nr:S-adenosyl-L-methionine-dependent methyltransferase [Gonapodya prolifera JEL478]|eukprot:KXS19758.1 S-adenosyl-L-methionine-dependent methyltransferase [Gonapodya prolifera JEL478]
MGDVGAQNRGKHSHKNDNARDPAYFGYYAQLTHQQNMLQDTVRTSTYHSAIIANSALFLNKTVLDVGAGSGILSYFSVQAGAAKVYAVEASDMALKMKKLLDRTDVKNTWMRGKVNVIQSKIEEPDLPIPQVDIIVSEPIGVLLVHERMIESFLHARDKYLKPGGALLPSSGTIFLAPFTDATLWTQTMAKGSLEAAPTRHVTTASPSVHLLVRFWESSNFYGVDLSPLVRDARDEVFGMPVVGTFDPRTLVTAACSHPIDFYTITVSELKEFVIPIQWTANFTGILHGIASWFDIHFAPSASAAIPVVFTLTTAPTAERTHWHQIRFLFKEPLAVNSGETLRGWFHLCVNDMRSYTVEAEVVLGEHEELSKPPLTDPRNPKTTNTHTGPSKPSRSSARRRRDTWELQDQTYYYGYDPAFANTQDYQPEYSCLYFADGQDEPNGETVDMATESGA